MPELRRFGRARRDEPNRETRPRRRPTQPLRGAFTHPADRREDRRGRFDSFSERASFLASSSLFFGLCVALVLIFVVGLIVGAGDRFETGVAGLMSSATLILVAVLKNSELRAERALQTKLDAIASSLLEDRRGHHGDAEEQLARSIRIQEEI